MFFEIPGSNPRVTAANLIFLETIVRAQGLDFTLKSDFRERSSRQTMR